MTIKVTKLLIAVGIAIVAGVIGYISYRFLGSDNAVEEQCEKVIEDQTGFEIDLSPDSPETEAKKSDS